MTGSFTRITFQIALFALLLVGFEQWTVVRLRHSELVRLDATLEHRARALATLPDGTSVLESDPKRLVEVVLLASRVAEARVTVIDDAGRVLADSDVDPARLPEIENHADREEVRAAARDEVGRASRLSGTVGRELRYVAVPAPGGGVVRLSDDLDELEARIAAARRDARTLIGVAALGSVALLQGFFWYFHRRPLRAVRRMAHEVAAGRLDARTPRTRDLDLDHLSQAIQDLAAQLRARLREVTEDKEQLDAVLEGMVEGVLVVDAGGGVVLANSRLREIFDIHGEIVGRPLLEGLRNPDTEGALAEAARSNDTLTRSITLHGAGDRVLQVTATRFPKEGERTGTVAVFHDVTQLMRLEEVRRDFVANASHELRTPLAAIQGFAETLLGGADLSAGDQKSYLEVIQRQSQRLTSIVEDLLVLSTIESQAMKVEIAPVDVGAAVRGLIADSALRFEERQLDVSAIVEGSPLALADARALDQVLGNLLDNAAKYTEPGGDIEVSVVRQGARVRVGVRDSGIGIPPEDRTRIFERFYRVDKARSRALGGTGLGLSIVKHLLQTMQGDIFVESEPERGSNFVFTLPAAD